MKDILNRIVNEIMKMPYGKEIHATHKTLPPNPYYYKKCVEKLIDELIVLGDNGTNIMIPQIQKLKSLVDNDINNLITDRKSPSKRFFNGVDEEMERISAVIKSIIETVMN